MLTKVDVVDGSLMLFGLTISLQDIQATLSIVIIAIDIIWLIGKFTIKFFKYIEDGNLSDDEVDDLLKTKDEIKNLREKLDDKEDKDKHE